MLQGDSDVSRSQVLSLWSSICHMTRFLERSHKSKKRNNIPLRIVSLSYLCARQIFLSSECSRKSRRTWNGASWIVKWQLQEILQISRTLFKILFAVNVADVGWINLRWLMLIDQPNWNIEKNVAHLISVTELWPKILFNTKELITKTGADAGFFLGGGAPLRNDVTDWWGKQILKANTEKALSKGRGGRVRTPCTPPLGLPL